MNEILRNIQKSVVDPKIAKLKQSVRGFVSAVYYEDRQCDVYYFDVNGAKRRIKRLALPIDGDGVFNQTVKSGDRVEISFRNQKDNAVFISRVYRRAESEYDYKVDKGQGLPISTHLF